MKNLFAKTLIGIAFFTCTWNAEAQQPAVVTPLPAIDWKSPCGRYAKIAIDYFAEAEDSGGISRATNSAYGHFALEMYRECRTAGTVYFFPNQVPPTE